MTPIYRYEPSVAADAALIGMWYRMHTDGDLERLYGTSDFSFATLYENSKPPNEMFYAVDSDGIYLSFWFNRFLSGAFMSGWIRQDRRASLHTTLLFRRIFRAALQTYKILLTLTWQEEILPLHAALGYKLITSIPDLHHGRTCHLSIARADAPEMKRWRSLKDLVQQPPLEVLRVPSEAEPPQAQQEPVEPLPLSVLEPAPLAQMPGPLRLQARR